ncbi:hypothetical protein ACH429_09255 [Streptomyces pathocidini]|uniref:Lipoprotein n=1 Tax=Streptomyces pathocidini TaxID=1650571 RepID=A0ABW7UNS0_9ACTN
MRTGLLGRLRRWYGEGALHLLLMLGSFALAGYAGVRLLEGDWLGVAVWFVGAALVHDLVLVPAYGVVDRGVRRALGVGVESRPGEVGERLRSAGVNHVRVPAFLSGLLLLVWFPLITRQVGHYTAYTGLPAGVFLGRWLLISAGLFAVSGVWLVVRLVRWSPRLRSCQRLRLWLPSWLRRKATKGRSDATH